MRDGPAAVSFAEKAVAATSRKKPGILDTLVAAYAEANQFAKAVNAQKEAIALLDDKEAKIDYATRLTLYESDTPFRVRQFLSIDDAVIAERDHGNLAELSTIWRSRRSCVPVAANSGSGSVAKQANNWSSSRRS